MRCFITGLDPDGRSCLIDEVALRPPRRPVDVVSLFRTRSSPPPSRAAGAGETRDLGVPPGQLNWMVSRWEPDRQAGGIHHTDTIDLDLVVAGSIELLLGDGDHRLTAGDCVVITGVDHGWRAGPEGCTLSVVLFGTPPPPDQPLTPGTPA